MAGVLWTDTGKRTLKGELDFLANVSPAKAEEVGDRILNAVERLELLPLMGRVVPEFKIEQLRELIVKPYRVIYRVRGEDCLIVAVHHSRRNVAALLPPEDLQDEQ